MQLKFPERGGLFNMNGKNIARYGLTEELNTFLINSWGYSEGKLEQNITLQSIESQIAFGACQIDQTVSIPSIVRIIAFGACQIVLNISLSGISSSLSTGSLQINQNVSLQSIVKTMLFGAIQVKLNISIQSITRIILFGTSEINLKIDLQSVVSYLNLGTFHLKSNVILSSIVRVTYFGYCQLKFNVSLLSITRVIIFGTFEIEMNVALQSIDIGVTLGDGQIGNIIFKGIQSNLSINEFLIVAEDETKILNQIDKDWMQIVDNEEFFIDGIFVSKRFGKTQNIKVLLDNEYEQMDIYNPTIGMTNTTVTCIDKFQYKPIKNDKMIINGINYIITSYESDDAGFAVLQLQNEKTN